MSQGDTINLNGNSLNNKRRVCGGPVCTWVAGVLLVEAIDSAKHEVENHLAVWIVHA